MARSTHPTAASMKPLTLAVLPRISWQRAFGAICVATLCTVAFSINILRAQQQAQSNKPIKSPTTNQHPSSENTNKPSRRNRIVIISTDGDSRARVITDSTETVVNIGALTDSVRFKIQEALNDLEDISVQNNNGVISFRLKGRGNINHRIIHLNADSIAETVSSSVTRSLRGLRDRLRGLNLEVYGDSTGQSRNLAITIPKAPRMPIMPRLQRYWEWHGDADTEFTSPEARKLDAESEAMRIEAKAARKKAEAEALLKEAEAMRKRAEAVRKEAEAKAKSSSESSKPTQTPKQKKNE